MVVFLVKSLKFEEILFDLRTIFVVLLVCLKIFVGDFVAMLNKKRKNIVEIFLRRYIKSEKKF